MRRSTLVVTLCLASTTGIYAQRTWPVDSLMHTWPVLQVAQAHNEAGKGVVRAVDSENLYLKIQEDAGTFPVFADSAVVRYADLFGQPKRDEFQALLGMAEEYFPMIEDALLEHELPAQLKLLPMALSGMNVHAATAQGERGLWMLTYPVAIRYGLRITADIDERSDAVKSTQAAVRYLVDLKTQYGTWPLAIMAFSCGPANVERARLKAPGISSYRAYYPKFDATHLDILPTFMAFIHLTARQEELGIRPIHVEFDRSADTLEAHTVTRFRILSDGLNIPMAQLRSLNPTFSNDRIPNGATFQLPAGMKPLFAQFLDSLEKVANSLELIAQDPSESVVEVDRTIRHTVRSGDNLGSIAQKYHVSVSQLKKWNGLRGDKIYAGKKLVIHVRDKVRTAPSHPDAEGPTNKISPTTSSLVQKAYTVQAGDSLYAIAKRYPGITVADLMQANGISSMILPGQKITIPQVQ
ncbi:MAG: LysM peptidoglycan-binding domain-containing protein [Flavobacteriales bacterium]|nr:LysM peptidoglycan-binding domain-containing protein [Flavobacteriales bacterium]MBK7241859.1 LysM peptidoglycan-binding domain-containing protein [Flavobacteriales bacterium]MBK9534690.1 LysM peptidoglycan-binding domain-containing protein [Flavobacteriales bacterium]MBP9138275.1 LysM peptidoglycan-binding domain-containing protein [Flavobacteriales bacterium]HQV51793.1 LysM peptidoglycan-binding domain-containing protein [Flavobacteriales bacterium]